MTAKTPERLRREAARECAEQLAVIVRSGASYDTAKAWIHNRVFDAPFDVEDVALVAASMMPPDDAYKPVVAERFNPQKARKR